MGKRTTAGSNPAGAVRLGRQDLRSPPARSLRRLSHRVVPSGKVYSRNGRKGRSWGWLPELVANQ